MSLLAANPKRDAETGKGEEARSARVFLGLTYFPVYGIITK
jgi:hypothetical protein